MGKSFFFIRHFLGKIILASCTLLLSISIGNYNANAQTKAKTADGKKISSDLFGIFFEDLNYAADGGLYAELIQNRSFEYSPSDLDNWNDGRRNWHALSSWEFITKGYGYGTISIETKLPVHENNPHYVVLNVEDEGQEGIGLINSGYDGIVIKAGEKYDFSIFVRQISDKSIPVQVKLLSENGTVIGETSFSTQTKEWKKYFSTIKAIKTDNKASLEVIAKDKGNLALDMISLFPQNTFKNRTNGLRLDLARVLADLKPAFIRFPGGCLVHGDGLGNMYRWKNTIGPLEQRVEQRNIWNYHQSFGLGFFEYFQFCEDLGAKPLPVVPAAVSCQNSGGTWRIGSTGQKAIPLEDMQAYIKDILDLIEYANGPVSSIWGAKRAEAGHPESFNLEYIGIGNEDKITPAFKERFKMIYDAVKQKHPEIKIVGTVGPGPSGEDYELGWEFANYLKIGFVDEHFYEKPGWFISNQKRYDAYNRSGPKVYIGEYASKGNTLFNAIAEAVFMTSLERNGDIVSLSSYAPLLAKTGHTQWNVDLIYFNDTTVCPTINYYVQQLFSINKGDIYYENIFSYPEQTNTLNNTLSFSASCVSNSKSGDIILKLVNADSIVHQIKIDLSRFNRIIPNATLTKLTGGSNSRNTIKKNPDNILPIVSDFEVKKAFNYDIPPLSLIVIRMKTKN